MSRHLRGAELDMAYEYMNWWLSGFAGAVMARQGYYMSAPERTKAVLAPEEWAYWYEGAPATRDLLGPSGSVVVKAGARRACDPSGTLHGLPAMAHASAPAFDLPLAAAPHRLMLIHLGAHGTLEWLPGKSVALSDSCWPEALIAATPVLYPFIVNDPGEAAQAKRRISAVTLGHLPPPLAQSATPDGLLRLERLLDEYSTADGIDPARRDRLIRAIRDEAQAQGVDPGDINATLLGLTQRHNFGMRTTHGLGCARGHHLAVFDNDTTNIWIRLSRI